MFAALANPDRFMAFSRWAAPALGVIAAALIVVGLTLSFSVPADYQQSATVHLMFIHVPAAWLSMFAYVCLGIASLLSFVFRHALADMAARAAAPLGAAFTALALITGAFWGRPMWGTWWTWQDPRLLSEALLLLLYLAYIALRAALDDEVKAGRAAAILAMAGVINLPIIHYSVVWWNSLHQGASTFGAKAGNLLPPVYLIPLALMGLGYTALFGCLWLVRIRAEVWRRRATVLSLRAAEA